MFLHNFPRINPKFTFPTFFWSFQEISWKCSKQFHKIISKYLKNVLKIFNISPKFSASIPKYVFQNSPNVHIFSTFFKRWNAKESMQTNNQEMITNVSNRNTEMHCCQILFSVHCWLANCSTKVIGEIQFNLQLPSTM